MSKRKALKMEEASRLFCEYREDFYCCSKDCYLEFPAKHVSLGRRALLQFTDQEQFLRERVKVRSLVVRKHSASLFSSSDSSEDENVEKKVQVSLGGSHHRSSFFVDSLASLDW